MTRPAARHGWWPLHGVWLWLVPVAFFALAGVLEATHGWIGYKLAGEPAIGFTLRGQSLSWPALVARTMPSWIVVGVLAPFVILALRRFPLAAGTWRRTVPIHVIGAVAFAGVFLVLACTLRYHLFLREEIGVTWGLVLVRYYAVYFNTFFLNYWALLGVYSAFRHHEQHRETLLLEKQLAEARLQSLQAQLRPHFLFNALNGIATLAREGDRRTVVRMIATLSELLRASFREPTGQLIPLRDELALVRRYFDLEMMRFSDRLEVGITADDELLDAAVPRFVLQPLVENALRHGIAASAGPGRVDVVATRANGTVELRVHDTGPGPRTGARTGGTGLRNTRVRLEQLYAGDASLELAATREGGTTALLRLPFTRHSGMESEP